MAKKKVKFMCMAFRDGFQSAYGARVLTEDFMPAVAAAREAGIDWFEAGGGARFQSLYFYCNEDAFKMMERFREVAGPDADLQTLSRGVNVVGLESQPSEIIKMHAELFKKHGISSIRNFDALNDVNNLIYSGQCIHEAGLNHQVSVTMMSLPPGLTGAHDADFYVKTLAKIIEADIPFDSVVFKDASGTATPALVHDTIKGARKILPPETLLHFHTHETSGCSVMCYKAALDGGADAIDLSLAPVSGGTCQPDLVVMWHALRGTDYDLDVDIEKVLEAEEVFKDCMSKYFLPPEALTVDPRIPWSPMPGGALTANTQMLRDNGLMDRYPEIIAAMREVVRLGGFGTSVTPVSQFYFQQAFNNVLFGPWKKIADGYGKMVLGYFGRTPIAPDPEVVKIASGQLNLEPTDKTPQEIDDADPKKGVAYARSMLQEAGLPETDENIFIAACCKEKGITYLKGEAKVNVRYAEAEQKETASAGGDNFEVAVDGKPYKVQLGNGSITVDGREYKIEVRDGATGDAGGGGNNPGGGGPVSEIKAPVPGLVLRTLTEPGATVKEGDILLVMEAMKMEVEIKATADGAVEEIKCAANDQVKADDVLVTLRGQ